MPNESDKVPAGWYPAPHGGKRYWDGKRWLALPDPDSGDENDDALEEDDATGIRKNVVFASIAAAIVLLVAGGFLIWKHNHDTQMRNEAMAASSSSSSSKAAADAAAASAQRETQAERDERAQEVSEVEASVKKMAEDQANKGLFEGPVLSVKCNPVSGGSTDDLTAKTTVFECFAATKRNDDGTYSGYKYHATVNWDTHDFTYGFGAPH
jgi:hypothetical protein